MLKITYESGIGRKIICRKADDGLYAVIIELSAHSVKISIKLSLVEATGFFSKGQNLVKELAFKQQMPIKRK